VRQGRLYIEPAAELTRLRLATTPLDGGHDTSSGRAEIWELNRPERLAGPAAGHPGS
jgi:hypothetical protein